jgi:hypothetical protein
MVITIMILVLALILLGVSDAILFIVTQSVNKLENIRYFFLWQAMNKRNMIEYQFIIIQQWYTIHYFNLENQ